jgi:GxxExxY protein
MPYDDEIPPGADRIEPSPELDHWARLVIGAAIEVHRELGPGCPEEAYHRAMIVEFNLRNIPFETQKKIKIFYKGALVGECKIDLLDAGMLVVELKSCEAVLPIHRVQIKTYMRLVRQPLGLLLNFNVLLMKEGVKRVIASEFDPRLQT